MTKSKVKRKGRKSPYKTKEWSDARKKVKERDGSVCCVCGKTHNDKGKLKVLTLSHLLPKEEYPKLIYDLDNLTLMCIGCHLYWYHKNPIEAYMWLVQYKGVKFINKLLKKAHEGKT